MFMVFYTNIPVSEAPKVEVVKKYESRVELEEYKTDEQKKEEVLVVYVVKSFDWMECSWKLYMYAQHAERPAC